MNDAAQSSDLPDDDLLELIIRYHDGQLDEYEMVALMALLEGDDRALSIFHDTALQALTIAEHAAVVAEPKPASPVWRRSTLSWLALAVSVAVVAAIAWSSWQPPYVVRVGDLEGQIVLLNPDGSERQLRHGDLLYDNQHIASRDIGSFATLLFADGTSIQIFDQTEISCRQGAGKEVEVFQGNVVADVAPQPEGHPLQIITLHSITDVLGTVLAIQVSPQRTDVDVLEGKVRVARTGDRSTVDVTAGEKTVVSRKVPLSSRPRSPVGNTWKVDFESGLPREWIKGIWLDQPLPEGSKGGARAEQRPSFWDPAVTWYEVESYNRWSRGICMVNDESRLQMRFFTQRAGWIQMILLTRDPSFKQSDVTYEYIIRNYGNKREAGWHTVDIPLSEFRRTIKDPKIGYSQSPINPPRPGLVIFKVIVSTQHRDLGLIVDEMSITAPGEPPPAAEEQEAAS
ncbi:FecR family protein [Bremerella cremea]|uniref:FecR family protein n=1 Tax=Bremerella cremea TaxID=1031537 RepID=UPI0031ED6C06